MTIHQSESRGEGSLCWLVASHFTSKHNYRFLTSFIERACETPEIHLHRVNSRASSIQVVHEIHALLCGGYYRKSGYLLLILALVPFKDLLAPLLAVGSLSSDKVARRVSKFWAKTLHQTQREEVPLSCHTAVRQNQNSSNFAKSTGRYKDHRESLSELYSVLFC